MLSRVDLYNYVAPPACGPKTAWRLCACLRPARRLTKQKTSGEYPKVKDVCTSLMNEGQAKALFKMTVQQQRLSASTLSNFTPYPWLSSGKVFLIHFTTNSQAAFKTSGISFPFRISAMATLENTSPVP